MKSIHQLFLFAIVAPSGRNIATNVFSQRDGSFHVEYIPLEVGE